KVYGSVEYDVIAGLMPDQRMLYVRRLLGDAGIWMARKKSIWLVQNFHAVQRIGGPEAAPAQPLRMPIPNGKIRFLKQTFSGIAEQGARSIMMAGYHEEFRNSLSIGEAMNRIITAVGFRANSYARQERFLQEVAAACGVEGWELDRL